MAIKALTLSAVKTVESKLDEAYGTPDATRFTIGAIDAFNQAKIVASNHFNLSSVTTVAFLFVLITIPQARWVDRLLEREQRRTRAG